MNRLLVLCIMVGAVFSMAAEAASFTEQNRKIAYLKESGSGADGKSAALKLESAENMAAQCFEDIIIFDAQSDAGKKTYKDFADLFKNKGTIKSITFTRDEEGDCKLEKFEK